MAILARRWLRRALFAALILLAIAIYGIWVFLRGSLPQLDGEVAGHGLHAAVSVARDVQGVPTITAHDRNDLAYATGYVHAQDRFFQMDLLRRSAAGELAELFGAAALPTDRTRRIHRFRARAEVALAALPAADRALLDRYVAGVNDGLAALNARPFEYGVLRQRPVPWRGERYAAGRLGDVFRAAGQCWRQADARLAGGALYARATRFSFAAV